MIVGQVGFEKIHFGGRHLKDQPKSRGQTGSRYGTFFNFLCMITIKDTFLPSPNDPKVSFQTQSSEALGRCEH